MFVLLSLLLILVGFILTANEISIGPLIGILGIGMLGFYY